MHCKDGCSALQEGLQCTASEMGKAGTEIASPILDRRKGREKGLLHSYTNSWKSVYALGISGVGKGVGCCPGVGLILHFPSGYGISLINLFTFRKLNQRISACVQGTPRRGNEHIAQGIALGMMKR